jgi:hypothetical protein
VEVGQEKFHGTITFKLLESMENQAVIFFPPDTTLEK